MKKIILSFTIALMSCLAMAQEGFGPKAGDISVSLQLGKATDVSDNLQYIRKNQNLYQVYAPSNSAVSGSSNSLVNMIGIEGKYFLSNKWAVRLSGMGLINSTPAQQDIPGVPNPDNTGSDLPYMSIPDIADVPSTSSYSFIANAGADYYFNVGNNRLFPYAGAQLNFNYGQRKDFTLQDDDLGERVSETYGLGGSLVGGIDYYLAEGFFIGIEVRALSYMYSVNRIFPQPGMEGADADNHSTTIFSNPMFKIGFKF
ncbi:MAG: hypothetical protein MI866_12945 [Bacteroidales bacterium]|nr:hypothetical protein [Bacteroidales bacterium]